MKRAADASWVSGRDGKPEAPEDPNETDAANQTASAEELAKRNIARAVGRSQLNAAAATNGEAPKPAIPFASPFASLLNRAPAPAAAAPAAVPAPVAAAPAPAATPAATPATATATATPPKPVNYFAQALAGNTSALKVPVSIIPTTFRLPSSTSSPGGSAFPPLPSFLKSAAPAAGSPTAAAPLFTLFKQGSAAAATPASPSTAAAQSADGESPAAKTAVSPAQPEADKQAAAAPALPATPVAAATTPAAATATATSPVAAAPATATAATAPAAAPAAEGVAGATATKPPPLSFGSKPLFQFGTASAAPSFMFGRNTMDRVSALPTAPSTLPAPPAMLFGKPFVPFVRPGGDAAKPAAAAPASKDSKDDDDEEGGDDDEEQKEEESSGPVVMTGEEDEETVYQTHGKLYSFDKASKSYKERGEGSIRINKSPATETSRAFARIVMRTTGSLRVILNVRLYNGMPIDQANPKSVRITAPDFETKESTVFLMKTSSQEGEKLFKAIKDRCDAEPKVTAESKA
ncbi:hypothetical protein CAOG_009766 [Capsaspora owczarzaki ATCC 30864]|uniref:RanBD1 domain-containing protein n=1 Tax=Capsaspora owczarzaki (strain ATCC 30864) TaxID=595528 RepID=A0A0D2WR47_CAPO3|nr:hypothetical protein CAOG_009766 [Capsaspora owczarzaki ATCC 30864]